MRKTTYHCDICGDEADIDKIFAIYFHNNKSGGFRVIRFRQQANFCDANKHICFQCAETMLTELQHQKQVKDSSP